MDWYENWIQSIRDFNARNEQQQADKTMIIAEATSRVDFFDRFANPRHATASAMVVGPRGIILHKHKKFNAWIQPGGHIDPGESPWDSAIREGREETGLQLVHPNATPLLFHISCHPAGEHFHLDSQYLVLGGKEDPSPPEGESQEISWFDLERAREVADKSMKDPLDTLEGIDLSEFGL